MMEVVGCLLITALFSWPSCAQLPAIAITPPGISLDENDGSDVVCVVKRTGLIPTGGLTVQLELLSILNKPSPTLGSDYLMSDKSVSFVAGAEDGAQSCITITAICDNEVEEDERVLVGIPLPSDLYMADVSGERFSLQTVTSIDEMNGTCSTSSPSPPRNLHHSTHQDNTPSTMIEWDVPFFTGGSGIFIQKYRIIIPQVMSYFEEESGTAHTITADGSDVMFNTDYNVEVTAVNTDGEESIPQAIIISISATEPPLPTGVNVTQCNQTTVTWMYGQVTESVYSPPIESVSVSYTKDVVSRIACPDLTTTDTSCVLTTPQVHMYTVSVNVTNVVGTSTASVSVEQVHPPSPPLNLQSHNATTDGVSAVVIEWDPPGNETEDDLYYRIIIPHTSYFKEVSCTGSECKHAITVDGSDVMFSTHYDLEVTSINTCGEKSVPAIITVSIPRNDQSTGEDSNGNNTDKTTTDIGSGNGGSGSGNTGNGTGEPTQSNDITPGKQEKDGSLPLWVSCIIGVTVVIAVLCAGVITFICCYCKRSGYVHNKAHGNRASSGANEMKPLRSSTASTMCQKSSTILLQPETGQIYSDIRHINMESANYQDPNAIEHEAAENGDFYAKKSKKEGEVGVYEVVSTDVVYGNVDTTFYRDGLVYADLDLPASNSHPSFSHTTNVNYSQVNHDQ